MIVDEAGINARELSYTKFKSNVLDIIFISVQIF